MKYLWLTESLDERLDNDNWLCVHILYISCYLYTYFTYFISLRNSFDCNIFHRKITKYSWFFIYEVSMGCIIAFIICFAIYTWKSSEKSLFCHAFDISVYCCSSNFWFYLFYFFENIISREMTTGTSITDYVTVLVSAHIVSMWKNPKKSTFNMRIILIFFWFF